jgi:hypothetical protein
MCEKSERRLLINLRKLYASNLSDKAKDEIASALIQKSSQKRFLGKIFLRCIQLVHLVTAIFQNYLP